MLRLARPSPLYFTDDRVNQGGCAKVQGAVDLPPAVLYRFVFLDRPLHSTENQHLQDAGRGYLQTSTPPWIV